METYNAGSCTVQASRHPGGQYQSKHSVAVALLCWLTQVSSLLRRFTRVGTMVFLLHDINDIFLEVRCSAGTVLLLPSIAPCFNNPTHNSCRTSGKAGSQISIRL